MNKKITALCSFILVFAVAFAVVGTNSSKFDKNDATYYKAERYYATASESVADLPSTTSFLDKIQGEAGGRVDDVAGNIGSYISNAAGVVSGAAGVVGSGSSGGLGDIVGNIGSGGSSSGNVLGGLGDIVGGVFGKDDTTAANVQNTTSAGYAATIATVHAATKSYAVTQNAITESQAASEINSNSEPSQSVLQTPSVSNGVNPYTKPTTEFKPGDSDESIKWIQWIFVYTGYGLDENGITGVLDDATVEVVKKLQQERGLTVDGNITDAVVDKAELLYYEYSLSVSPSAEGATDVTQMPSETQTADNTEKSDNTAKWITVIAVALIWVIAVAVILVIFIIKKKKTKKPSDADKKEKKPSEEKTLPPQNDDENENGENSEDSDRETDESEEKPEQTVVKSMADLFEEANDK